mmetsp:Transcript_77481/g.171565  ORF Transcript_77481/g.171565 Transcript_77481/m.171565 type:complete len:268 (-) Transcript_77481:76-879(-)
MAMHRRLQKELPMLRKKTLLNDGLAIEEGDEAAAPAAPSAHRSSGSAGSPANVSFVALLAGPRDSPYEGGVFRLEVSVPRDYPMTPPKISFQTRIFHPNVGRGHTPGAICLDILRKEAWSPALTLERTLLSIASLLADPNPASPMDGEAASLYQNNRPAYDRRVQDWVRKYAQGSGGADTGAWEGDFGKADAEGESDGKRSSPASLDAKSTGGGATASGGEATAGTAPALETARTEVQAAGSESLHGPFVIDVSDDEMPAAKRARGP